MSASPHGDSIESSGRPEGSVGRDTQIADNLLLFDGENSNVSRERNVKQTGKRGNDSLLEQSSEEDGRTRAKETEDSLIFHLGVKRQAYARRNRSKSSRDNHSNKAPSVPNNRNGNRSIREARADDHMISAPKPASPNANVISNASPSNNKLDMEVDGMEVYHANADKMKRDVQVGEAEGDTSEALRDVDQPFNDSSSPAEQVAKDDTSAHPHSISLQLINNTKIISGADDSGIPDKGVSVVFCTDQNRNNYETSSIAEELKPFDMETNTFYAEKENRAAESANSENCGMVKNVEGASNEGSSEISIIQRTSDNGATENGQHSNVEIPFIAADEPKAFPTNNLTINIKDEAQLVDNRTDVPSEVIPLLGSGSLQANGEMFSKLEGKSTNSLGDNSQRTDMGVVTASSMVVSTSEPSATALTKRGSLTTSSVQNSAANQLKLAQKAQEDAILKEARIIEVRLTDFTDCIPHLKYWFG